AYGGLSYWLIYIVLYYSLHCFHLIDTAQVYDVEVEVGRGMRKSGVPREDIFLATKLWCNTYHPDDVERALDVSLRDLDTPYVDLLLMHYPCVFARGTEPGEALKKVLSTGKAKAIGVSNFSKGEIQTLLDECSVGIHVIQFSPYVREHEPFLPGDRLEQRHSTHRGKNQREPVTQGAWSQIQQDPCADGTAWGINSGRSVIPKSVIDWQIDQNIVADFEMEEEDVKRIGSMDRKARFNDPSADY
ncbi:putative oxidoreductase, partial [Lachnellula arida]